MYQGISLDQAPPEDIPLRFFLTAPFFGILGGILLLWNGKSLFLSNWNFETIALTHMFTLGWLAMVMFGATYQMVPVLVGGSVPFIHFARVTHALFLGGVALLVTGLFLFSRGDGELAADILLFAAFLLIVSIGSFLVQLFFALFRVEINDRPTVLAMRISVSSLAVTILLGVSFLGNFSGWWAIPWDRINLTGVHITFGLFGWVGMLILGVGFHMIPMFYVTPSFDLETAFRVIRLFSLSLILVPLSLLFGLSSGLILVCSFPGALAIGLYIWELYRLLRNRRRKMVDTTMRFWQWGLPFLGVATCMLAYNQWNPIPRLLLGFGVFYILGFAVALTNGMIYKIVPFILWFHRYSTLIGKVPVPMLHEIAPDDISRFQWWSFIGAIGILGSGVLFQDDWLIRGGGLLLMYSSWLLFRNILKAYKMDIPEPPKVELTMDMFKDMMKPKS